MSTYYAACLRPQNWGYIVKDYFRIIDKQCVLVLQSDDALILSRMLWNGQFCKERGRKKLKEETNDWTP